mmetsp:Transcript_4935/g.13448  ORF Transcript_4935/g.13448 Transcript_4935/m.13448 type:complete len:203 (+) Transcript_4935:529-1137(+)
MCIVHAMALRVLGHLSFVPFKQLVCQRVLLLSRARVTEGRGKRAIGPCAQRGHIPLCMLRRVGRALVFFADVIIPERAPDQGELVVHQTQPGLVHWSAWAEGPQELLLCAVIVDEGCFIKFLLGDEPLIPHLAPQPLHGAIHAGPNVCVPQPVFFGADAEVHDHEAPAWGQLSRAQQQVVLPVLLSLLCKCSQLVAFGLRHM